MNTMQTLMMQAFMLGVGVASAIWLLVGVFVSWLMRPSMRPSRDTKEE